MPQRADGGKLPQPRGADAPGPAGSPRVDPVAYREAVLDVVELIPEARVLTYGDIAELLECGGPRQVGRALARSTRAVAWWRVLRAGGHPPRGLAVDARRHYDDEGTPLAVCSGPAGTDGYRVDLVRARWWPSSAQQERLSEVGAALRGGSATHPVGRPDCR